MIRRIELTVGVAASVLLAAVHVIFLLHAGALWRDEVNSVNLASMSVVDFRENFHFDSFPAVWFSLLRAWMALGPGPGDGSLRTLGLLVGLGVVGVLWWHTRRTGLPAPLFSLAFLGFNAAVVSFGDSLRAYGLGMLTGIAAFTFIRQFVERPRWRRGLPAGAMALLAVHCTYYNAIVLLAACAGGAVLSLHRRRPAAILRLVAVALPAALSLLVYAHTFRQRFLWNPILCWPIDLAWTWTKFREATQMTMAIGPWLWVLFTIGALAVAILLVAWPGTAISGENRDNAAFYGAALGVGVITHLAFLLALRYHMQPWYFLSLLALAAVCFDGILLSVPPSPAVRPTRLAVAVLLVCLAWPGVWVAARERKSNLDRVASTLAATATAADVIVVTPWQHGITFARYYRGAARWTTVPPMDSHQVHRYDLLQRAMQDPDAMRPVLDLMAGALREGNRVFWVGALVAPPAGQPPPTLPPAPAPPWGWREMPHYEGWGLQAGALVRDRALRSTPIPIAVEQPVSLHEYTSVTAFEGWRKAGVSQ